MKQITSLVLAAALLVVAVVEAKAAVTTNEAEIDAIYSQASFGGNPFNVRFESTVNINHPGLLNIDTALKSNDLFGLAGAGPTVSMFFVDTIDYCDSFNVDIIGCGQIDGNVVAVESTFAAGPSGAELMAQEQGHGLGLVHVNDSNNLMF